jgi:prepilin-type processing-associated H-X9-DG protein
MNASDTLDYALGQLEGDDLDRARREVDADPALEDRVETLTGAIHLLLDDDPSAYEPPSGLAWRTLEFALHEAVERPTVLEFVPSRRRFRLEDLAVAATIFLASLLALTPAILRGKDGWGRAACANQLQKVGVRLHQYAALHHEYPFVGPDEAVPHVGAMLCRLNDAGFSIEPKDLQCPCSGSGCGNKDHIPNLSAVEDMLKRSPAEARRALHSDYALHVGSRRPQGPGPLPASPIHAIPILADRPNFDESGQILAGNSPNHGGRGQNVLYADGHVAWQNNRWVSPRDADLYLNNENRPAYGVDVDDSVLMPSCLRVNAR